MSTTTISTLRVELFPPPPPTNNTLDPEQRSRLLRSTRKLGDLLGTTPFLLEPEAEDSIPRVHASRREVRVFHSPSSSMSYTDASEPEYVLVNSGAGTAPYQYQSVAPPASRTPSPMPVNKKRKGGATGAEGVLPPIAIVFDIPGSTKARSRSMLSKSREQPLLLRLRPLPTQKDIDSRINATTTVDPSIPLSPIASSMNVDNATSDTTLSDREKRRKMAKLTRTLGENIPPELVFRSSPSRRTSISISRSRVDPLASFQKPTKFVSSASVPPLAVAAVPKPSTQAVPQPQQLKRKHRPRSLSLGTASAITAANIALSRGTTSLDVKPTVVPKPKEAPFVAVKEEPTHLMPQSTEWGRRKEREWSGEWNIKDMDDVAKKLRELRRR
ncbi:hypothetical protein M413DRAFT_440704 [Hebeloma cylindrosporum]|uniref:Uncharacterized protein n=1 Tax=Hebeloma cylindrosporum TaxID=76867 RepID=A0A0C3CEK9_HEBCY|nr:hypothetical protein M413DRAFT_440704 [Hebeloma cylindrosporum h7]